MSLKGILKRYVFLILVFWGFFMMYVKWININVVIGVMVKNYMVFVDGVEIEKVKICDYKKMI